MNKVLEDLRKLRDHIQREIHDLTGNGFYDKWTAIKIDERKR
jgi:hypothetical protein